MTGGMTPKRDGLSLVERSTRAGVGDVDQRERTRHCWVSGLPDAPGRWPGLLAEWDRKDAGAWWARVVYAVDDGKQVVLVEAWVPAEHLEPSAP